MMSVRLYMPLLGFVLPTVVVGYGVVIPRSCIAGVNELTIGFGTTILGAIFTYVAGQRAALAAAAPPKPPLRLRIARAINQQAASPSGWIGRVLGFVWPREHGKLNLEVIEQLDVRPGQHVLEVGVGTGHAMLEAGRRARGGHVLGVDVSELMVRLARARNREEIAHGNVDVRVGDIAALSLDGMRFDRIFSVHCIYFWQDAKSTVAKLAGALRPGGKLVLAFRPEGDDVPARFRDPVYRFPRVVDLEPALERAGMEVARVESSMAEPGVLILTAVRR